ncbi:protein kinase [Nocardioides sp. CGMCC 1.13656]|uniref:serine/threonine protein kinase n=1 Tax=Nocardioides TaxID=1839 RepID=UPI0012FBBA36|nr:MULTISPECIES: serine/threonine-protein kinase [unclassified Nocardioides]MBA2953311.1 protein kinase [Nocardioides sp. CGMCC 1.13656]
MNPGDPDRVGRFNVVARLGAGGMGVAYMAQTDSGDPVVIKAVQIDFADTPEARRRFRQEVLATAAVESPFVPQVLASDLSAARQWVAIEYVAGPTLGELIRRDGPLARNQQYALAAALAAGLAELHANGLIHRDVKPDNIICTTQGPRLIDFGIATRSNIRGLTATGALAPGSPGWMAPEQLDPLAPPTPAIDVFAWGCVCWYASGTRSPFAAPTTEQSLNLLRAWRVDEATPPASLHPDLASMVLHALAATPVERPTALALAECLGDAAGTVTSDLVATAWDPAATTAEVIVPTVSTTQWEPSPDEGPGLRAPRSPRRIRRDAAAASAAAIAVCVAFASGVILADDPAQTAGPSTSESATSSPPGSTNPGGEGEGDREADGEASPIDSSENPGAATASQPAQPATPTLPSSNAPPPGYGGDHPIGYGQVKLGMTRAQLLATGEATDYSGNTNEPCLRYSLRAGGYAGYSVALKRVVYIEFTGKMATSRGIRIGSTEDEVFAAYPNASADRMQNVYPRVAPGVFYTIGIWDGLVELLILESERQDCAM